MNNWKEEFDKQFVEVDSHPAILLNSASDAIGASMYIRQITFISELLEIQNEKFIKDLDRLSRYSRNDADIENIQELNDCYKKNRDSRLSLEMMDIKKIKQDAYKRGLEEATISIDALINNNWDNEELIRYKEKLKQEGIKEGLERAIVRVKTAYEKVDMCEQNAYRGYILAAMRQHILMLQQELNKL